jgi:hypothetical protein
LDRVLEYLQRVDILHLELLCRGSASFSIESQCEGCRG